MKNQTTTVTNDAVALWGKKIKAAHQKWDKITEAELTKLDGTNGALSKLLANRYHIEPQEADKQVNQFMATH